MAWNRPSNDGRANAPGSPRRAGTARPTKAVRGVIAGAVVVLGAAVAAWWLWPTGETRQDATSTKRGLIKEVTPAAAPKVAEEEEKKPEPPKYWEQPTTNGLTWRQAKVWYWKRRPKPSITNDSSRTEAPPAYCIFSHDCDNKIALYLSIEPGQTLVGAPEYGEAFKKDFAESLKEPIIVTKDDDEWTANLKRAVTQTKIELIDRMNAGEDIGKILEDTHEELRKMCLYKSDIEQTFHEQIKELDNPTEEDIEDAIKAANMLLDQKGIAPMRIGTFTKKMLMRHVKPKTED